MRRNYRVTVRRICAAAALAITVAVGGVTALAPAASADVAVASAATRSAAPSSPQGPETLHPHGVSDCTLYITTRYPAIDTNLVFNTCNLVPAAITVAPHDWRAIAAAAAICVGTFRKQGVSYVSASFACLASGLPTPFGQEEWCTTTGGTACLNAWSGGPWVNDYTGGFESRDSNQDFVLSAVDNANGDATGNYQLGFAGSGSWAGHCIGDAYNDSGNASVSLDGCGNGTGGGSGWGTNFTVGTSGCPAGEEWLHNNHWNGYLGPVGGAVNGSHFYLNKPSKYCFSIDFISTVPV